MMTDDSSERGTSSCMRTHSTGVNGDVNEYSQ